MGDMRISVDRIRGGVVVQNPPNPAIGWELAARLSEDRDRKYVDWKALKTGLGGCNDSTKEKNHVWNWPVSEPVAVVVDEGITLPPPEYWIDVSAADGFACGLANTGEGFCWGTEPWHEAYLTKKLVPERYEHFSQFKVVVVGGNIVYPFACWLETENGKIICRGNYPVAGEYEGPFRQMAAGDSRACNPKPDVWSYVCALHVDHRIECWGDDEYGETHPPDALFRHIDIGEQQTCGVLLETGGIMCWGHGFEGYATLMTTVGPLVEVSLSNGIGSKPCVIDEEGALLCKNGKWASKPRNARYSHVIRASGSTGSLGCAIRDDYQADCWGIDEGQRGGMFNFLTRASAGRNGLVCGLSPEGAILCLGGAADEVPHPPWNP